MSETTATIAPTTAAVGSPSHRSIPTAPLTENRPRVLLIVPEHTAWERAKSLGYVWSFGLEEGLMACGCEVVLVPAFSGFASSDRSGWLGRVQDLLRLQKFDQVWVNALQVMMEPGLLSLLATLVPVRVAFFDESLDHGGEEMTRDRSLAERKNRVLDQVRDYTHCVCADEKDCRILARMGFNNSHWLPGLVPASLYRTDPALPTRTTACFAVAPNGSFAAWAAQSELLALLEPLLITDDAINVEPRFDQLNREVLSRLPNNSDGNEFSARALTLHVKLLRALRIEGLDVLVAETRQHLAYVVDTVRPGRIMEDILCAMAGGVPVIIPRSSAEQLSSVVGEGGYLCYDEANPESLKLLLENLAAQPEQRRQLVATALVEVRGRFSSATRVTACLEWMRNSPAARHNLSRVEHQEAVAPKPGPTREEEDAYYRDLFVNDPFWSSKNPNPDECARWEKISECLQLATQTMGTPPLSGWRILDVGCGRGWLTNLVSAHGHAEGVEPVPCVIEHARKLFPKLRFHVGTVENVLEQPDYKPFDIVVSSEVIEHVPDAVKPVFIGHIRRALKPGGVVIITTPRKEIQPQLQKNDQQSRQPIEEWLSEAQVRQHFMGSGFRALANHRVLCDLRDNSYPAAAAAVASHPQVVGLYQVWCFQAPLQAEAPAQPRPELARTTAYILTIGDPVFAHCREALDRQTSPRFDVDVIAHLSPFHVAATEMFRRCRTEFLIQVDEDMILFPDAVKKMERCMAAAPDNVGMICFHLYDQDRESNIQGVKIYRTSHMQKVFFQDKKASEMDLLEQMARRGVQWIAHPDVVGRHGTLYTPDTIYHRYRTMYEKDIRTWNVVTWDLRKKATKFQETGDVNQLFALLGAAHGVVNAPYAEDREKDFRKYNLRALDVFKRLLLEPPRYCSPYDPAGHPQPFQSQPIPFDQIKWKTAETSNVTKTGPRAGRGKTALRILHTVEFYAPHIGGAEFVVQQISERLAKRGHHVTVATSAHPERSFRELNGVEVCGFAVQGKLAERITGETARYERFLREHPADVMMNYAAQQWATDLALGVIADTAARRVNLLAPCGYSALVDVQTLRWPHFRDYFEKVLPRVLPAYDAVVYHSGIYKDFAFGEHHHLRNGIIIPNGTDEEEFTRPCEADFREKYKITTRFFGLCVANFYPAKGQERLIESVRQLNRPDFTMVFIGKEGDQLASLQKQAAGLNIRFLVGIPREDTVVAFRSADLFLFASHIEASPLVILEAKAAKLPFLSTDCGNVREWKGGVVCSPEDLASQAGRLLDDEPKRRQLAEEGWREWKDRLTWNAVVDQWEDLYLRLQSRKSHAAAPMVATGNKWPAAASTDLDPQTAATLDVAMIAQTPPAEAVAADVRIVKSFGQEVLLGQFGEHTENSAQETWTALAVQSAHGAPASTIASSIVGVIFSKDRPLQLDGTLRSFFARCQDADRCQIKVLYRASSECQPLYDTLIREYPMVGFVAEQDFRSDLIKLLDASESVLFVVDDNLFIRNFTATEMVEALREHPQAIGFSMRLGRNTTFCYPLNKMQRLPSFETVGPEILRYDWTSADCDFNYPLEVSSSVYRAADVLPLLREMPFKNPNTLEGEFAARAPRFYTNHPQLLCFGLSRAFCNPINLVQKVCQNRTGGKSNHSPERLAEQFQAGARLDVEAYINFTPAGCHQEVPLHFVKGSPSPSGPAVSVVIPCYKQAHYLPEAVQSVLDQTFTDWELIIVNDGSPDNTAEVARELAARHSDKMIVVLTQPNGGLSGARNAGMRAARGRYLLPLDADDKLMPEFLHETVAVLDRHLEISVAYTDLQCFEGSNEVIPKGEFGRNLMLENRIAYCSLLRRKVWEAVGGYNPNMSAGYEDWDFWVGAVERDFRGLHIPKSLFLYRVRAQSMISTAMQRHRELISRIVLNHPLAYDEPSRNLARELLLANPLPAARSRTACISVVIPCYKQAQFLLESVSSVVAQTFQNWEIIIVNDGSPDDTSAVATQLMLKHPGRISLLEKANGGLSSARNAGIRTAQGEYIFLLDADDRIQPTMLEKTKTVLDTQPKVGFAYTHIQHFGALNDVFPLPEFDRATLISKDNIVCGNCLVRKAAWQQAGGYNELMREGYEDWDFWISCVEHGWEGFRIPEPLFCYRKSATSMLSGANQKRERLIATIVCNHPRLYDAKTRAWADEVMLKSNTNSQPPIQDSQSVNSFRVTYLISSILGVTGGNQTLLRQADELQRRGHDVTIVTYTPKPNWFTFKMRVVQVPSGQAMAPHVPPSDVVISTYFINAHELLAVKAAVKVYYAQGDQFVFADTTLADSPENRRWRELSRESYLLPQVRFVPNSHNLARAVENMTGRKPDGLLPVCTDQTIFRPLQRSLPGSKVRILIVGPDVRGSSAEPLLFKGIQDIHDALHLVVKRHPNFTVVRMSGSPPEIFQRFPCEFYVAPSDEMKTVLFGTADILIYASHYDSCPRPPQEAMAAGCAVVCTATPGAMEYCRDGENCLLVPIQSPQAIADATLRLMTDRALRDQLVQGGFATARKYPRELEWNELETMMHQFVEEASNAPTPARASLPLHPAQPAVVAMPPVGKMGSLN